MQIDAQHIENMFIISIIHDYGVGKKKTLKKNLPISFEIDFELKLIFIR
jgi:hypothetical protein